MCVQVAGGETGTGGEDGATEGGRSSMNDVLSTSGQSTQQHHINVQCTPLIQTPIIWK